MQSKSTFPARIAPFSVLLLFYRENGSGSGTEKGAIRAGNVDLLCIAVSP